MYRQGKDVTGIKSRIIRIHIFRSTLEAKQTAIPRHISDHLGSPGLKFDAKYV